MRGTAVVKSSLIRIMFQNRIKCNIVYGIIAQALNEDFYIAVKKSYIVVQFYLK